MHPVVEYLKTNSIESLGQFGIDFRYSESKDRVSLNYDQIRCINGHELVNHCRGLVLRTSDLKIMAWPFNRSYNYGTEFAAKLDSDSISYQEKLDGTCIIVYHDDVKWCVATRAVPEANIPNGFGKTFAELFWNVSGYTPNTFPGVPGRTYIYELTGPDNIILVVYEDWAVTQLGVIDNENGNLIEGFAGKVYNFPSLEEAFQWSASQAGVVHEGFILFDKYGNRVKAKNPNYVALARLMVRIGSLRGLLEIILNKTDDDTMPYLPKKTQESCEEMRGKIRDYFYRVESFTKSLDKNLSRKDLAIHIQASPYSSWIGIIIKMLGDGSSFSHNLESLRKNGSYPYSTLDKLLKEIGY